MYRDGEGVSQNYGKAAQWTRLAAEQGYADAQVNLSRMYYFGEGVSRNLVMTYLLSSLAAAQGNENARLYREAILTVLSREQIAEGQRMASEWRVGTPLPYFKDFSTWP
jgi:TPR repeat protein